jgi:hypothetical protein
LVDAAPPNEGEDGGEGEASAAAGVLPVWTCIPPGGFGNLVVLFGVGGIAGGRPTLRARLQLGVVDARAAAEPLTVLTLPAFFLAPLITTGAGEGDRSAPMYCITITTEGGRHRRSVARRKGVSRWQLLALPTTVILAAGEFGA